MLLLGIFINTALILSVTISTVFVNSKALIPAAATRNEYWPSSRTAENQRRKLDASGALISLDRALSSSNSTEDRMTKIDHEIDCFPPGSRLPDANADDCGFIINSIIPGMKDPLRVQTWGFTDEEEINLSLPEYRWTFKSCFIRVKNIDETQVDRFRPVDVAELAQRVVRKCIVETKERLGGNADIGHLSVPLSFYVVASGSKWTGGQSSRNDTVLALPSEGFRTLESRASLNSPGGNTISSVLAEGLKAGERYPVHCFDPTLPHRVKPTIASDCAIIINEIILRLPNPMFEQTFGFTEAEDIDLSIPENNHWVYGQCAVFIRNFNMSSRDLFRFVDVASAAHRITEQCVEGSKYAIGGTADVGTIEDNFYVGVGGVTPANGENDNVLVLASDTAAASPNTTPTSSLNQSTTESADLDKRSSNIIGLLQATNDFAPVVRCLQPGMPAARKIEIQDCTNAAKELLYDPKILLPQQFTTEPTGGIRMPFIQRNQSCYLMMDTKSDLSISDSIPLLKMVYWALEIMLKCVSGRELGVGGVSRLDNNKEIFVSVTGVDPTFVGNGLANLSDENSPLQKAVLGQS